MKAGRRATAAVTRLSLPSHYAIIMHNGVAGGTQRWCAQVQLPLYRAMRLGDLPVASRLRSICLLDTLVPREAFLQPLRTRLVGLEISPCIMYCTHARTLGTYLGPVCWSHLEFRTGVYIKGYKRDISSHTRAKGTICCICGGRAKFGQNCSKWAHFTRLCTRNGP